MISSGLALDLSFRYDQSARYIPHELGSTGTLVPLQSQSFLLDVSEHECTIRAGIAAFPQDPDGSPHTSSTASAATSRAPAHAAANAPGGVVVVSVLFSILAPDRCARSQAPWDCALGIILRTFRRGSSYCSSRGLPGVLYAMPGIAGTKPNAGSMPPHPDLSHDGFVPM